MGNLRLWIVLAPMSVLGAIFIGIIIAEILWYFFNRDKRDPPSDAP